MTTDLRSKCQDFLERQGYLLTSPETIGLDELVPPLIQILANVNDEHLLEEAVRYLGMIGRAAEPAIKPLVLLIARNPITPTVDEIQLNLSRNKPWMCGQATRAAMDAMRQICPEKAIEAIDMLCHDADPQVRFQAALALQAIGEPADRVIPRLVELSRDRESQIRRTAVLALWPYQSLGEETLYTLLARSTDPDLIVRVRVDYLLASKLSGYQRRYPDGIIDLANLLCSTVDVENDITAVDIIRTIPMMGNDATRFAKRIMDLLQSKVSVAIPAIAAISMALREIVHHYPSLRKLVLSSLRQIAVPGNQVACFVNDNLVFMLSQLKSQHQ
jgi:hypothetical protein